MNTTLPYPYSTYLYPTSIPSWMGSGIGLICAIVYLIYSIRKNNPRNICLAILSVPVSYTLSGICFWSMIYTPVYFYHMSISSGSKQISILVTSYILEGIFVVGMYIFYIKNETINLLGLSITTTIAIPISGIAVVFWGFILGLLVIELIKYYQVTIVLSLLVLVPSLVVAIIYLRKRCMLHGYTQIEERVNEDA